MSVESLLTSGALFLTSIISTLAQDQFQFVFTGTCWTTNSSGTIVPRPITNATLLADFATANGVKNISGLALAYPVGGNELGDTIDVINRTNGAAWKLISNYDVPD